MSQKFVDVFSRNFGKEFVSMGNSLLDSSMIPPKMLVLWCLLLFVPYASETVETISAVLYFYGLSSCIGM